MKNVLFIAYYFPPMGGSGVQRSLKYVKYLHLFDINPIVLTVDSRWTRWPKDRTFLNEIPQDVTIYRAPTIDMNWIFKLLWGFKLNKVVTWLQLNLLVPDAEITWLPFARLSIKKIVKQHHIDAVYITGGPFSSLILGPFLKKKYNLKYIVDFRDEWTNNHTRLDKKYPVRSRNKDNNYELEAVTECSAIVYTHPKFMKESFERKYSILKQKPFQIITNGYDEADFEQLSSTSPKSTDMMRIIYPGSFYDRRRPTVIWNAIKELINNGIINADQLRVEIYGKNTPKFVLGDFYEDEDILRVAKFYPYCTHHDSVKIMLEADALLLFLAPGPNSEPEIPGKLFEYLRSYRPIIAIVPPNGCAADIINKCRSGWVCDSNDSNKVLMGISELITLWKNKNLQIHPDKDCIKQYERMHLTSLLADVLDKV